MSQGAVRDAGFAESSLPRSNGSPAFDAPWQARAHAMAVLLVEESGRNWDDFRGLLIEELGDRAARAYWESWVTALERFVDEAGLVL